MQAAANPDGYKISDEIRTGTGPLPRPLDSGYRGADYDFITAEAQHEENRETSIRYTLDTKRARSEVRAQKTQGQLLRDLVATASNAESQDPQIGRTLFKLLVPLEMEAVLAGTGEMQIELEPETAGIPWELLDTDEGEDRTRGTKPWAIRTKLLRKLRIEDYRVHVTDASVDAHILIIGEPACPKNYPRLNAAREEASAVYQFLASANGVGESRVKGLFSDDSRKVGPDARKVINALLERPWRIAHIAGHGALSEDGKTGGVVLSNGAFLGPNEIATMRAVPELVFVNCCHLAARDPEQLLAGDTWQSYDRPKFASGVAEQLIKIGVKCVIAAGWAVDDITARTFATAFYKALLRGARFIDAVAEAREAAYAEDGNTWAAYQCYGDPDWVFRRDGGEADIPTTPPVDEFAGIASAAALKLALETIAVQTKFQHFKPPTQIEKLRLLEQQFAAKWGGIGSVAELFGAAYVTTKDFASALQWYERAVASEDGTAALKAAEQLANMRSRLAWETVETALKQQEQRETGEPQSGKRRKTAGPKAPVAGSSLKTSVTAARHSIRQATAALEKLVAIHPTVERESLYGSAYKRLALVEAAAQRPAEERKALEAMKVHYRRAAELAREQAQSNAFYPALNYLAAELVLHAGRSGWKGLDTSVVESTRASLEAKNHEDPDFWSVVGETELELYLAVAAGKLASSLKRLEEGYREVHQRVSEPGMWSSVYDTTKFVLQKYAPPSAKEREAAKALLVVLAGLASRSELL